MIVSRILLSLCLFWLFTAQSWAQMKYAIAIHGGAGDSSKWSNARRAEVEKTVRAALQQATQQLSDGKSSLDVVESVIRILEDDPLFNAGRGSVFNSIGRHELDASIMSGRDRSCGAVAGVSTVKNPISLARLVMTQTPHVLLAGTGAEQFADAMKVPRVDNEYFATDEQRAEWEQARQKSALDGSVRQNKADGDACDTTDEVGTTNDGDDEHLGTVGCVALDQYGNLAAGTSTGGLQNKRFGRIGDSPVIGAGTFADNESVAISCTGRGEDFIRNSIAHHISALVSLRRDPLDEALHEVLTSTTRPISGGIIAIDHSGNVSMQFNTAGMTRAMADADGKMIVFP